MRTEPRRVIARDLNTIISPITKFSSDHGSNLRNTRDSMVGITTHLLGTSLLYSGIDQLVNAKSEIETYAGIASIALSAVPSIVRYRGLDSAQAVEDLRGTLETMFPRLDELEASIRELDETTELYDEQINAIERSLETRLDPDYGPN